MKTYVFVLMLALFSSCGVSKSTIEAYYYHKVDSLRRDRNNLAYQYNKLYDKYEKADVRSSSLKKVVDSLESEVERVSMYYNRWVPGRGTEYYKRLAENGKPNPWRQTLSVNELMFDKQLLNENSLRESYNLTDLSHLQLAEWIKKPKNEREFIVNPYFERDRFYYFLTVASCNAYNEIIRLEAINQASDIDVPSSLKSEQDII